MKKQRVIKVLTAVMSIIVIGVVTAYFIYRNNKPWLAFFIACCGGVLVVNIIISIIFINKNFRDRRGR